MSVFAEAALALDDEFGNLITGLLHLNPEVGRHRLTSFFVERGFNPDDARALAIIYTQGIQAGLNRAHIMVNRATVE